MEIGKWINWWGNGVSKRNKQKVVLTEEDLWNTAIFFPDYFPDDEDTRTRQLIWYLEQATTSIDVCHYTVSFRMIEDALITKAKQGIAVRVISNWENAKKWKMRKAGIHVRAKCHIWFNPQAPSMPLDLLHHKFVVIDRRAIMSGSLNWSSSSITENKENVMITTNSKIVNKLANEFERLWEESKREHIARSGKNRDTDKSHETNAKKRINK